MRHQRIARLGAGAASLLLLVSACSTDREGEDNTNPDANGDSTAAAADLPTDTFGDLESPCGPGDASGATDQGVTDSEINIGYGDDKGFTATPGLNQEMGDAVAAMIEWCNGLGGINGRQIVGHRYDGKIFEAAQVMKEACAQDFMMVGHGFGLDENAEPERIACKMPSVPGFTISQAANMGPMKFEPIPSPIDEFNPSSEVILVKQHPEFKKVGFVNSDSAAVDQGIQRYLDNFEFAGAETTDCGVELKSAGGDNYRAIVQKYKDCGVTSLFTLTPASPPLYSFKDAALVEGLELPFANNGTWYNSVITKSNVGGLHEGTLVTMQFQPFENADTIPAVADYLSVMDEFGGVKALLGMQSASAFLLWATVAKDCGADLTRQCMVDGLSKVTSWTGGGLHTETDPGGNHPGKCALITTVKGSSFEQSYPAKGEFECVEDFRRVPESQWSVELTEDRIATKYLTDDVITPKG